MSTQEDKKRLELLHETLDILILRTRILRAAQTRHRARHPTNIRRRVALEHGALYPAPQRWEGRGWISAKCGISSKNRKARSYSLTAAGRKQLLKETTKWKWLTAGIGRILDWEAKRS
jgi:DNA-binding PadR family transcriptional regulator